MLLCNCGWQGMDLVPYPKDNTARCPKCKEVFKGIPAARAILQAAREKPPEKMTHYLQGDSFSREAESHVSVH